MFYYRWTFSLGELISALFLIGVSLLVARPAFSWEIILNNPDGPDLLLAVATDSADNIIGAGLATRASGDRAFVVVKFSGLDGSVMWFVEIDGRVEGDDEALAVAVNSNDDVLVVGRLRNHNVPQDSPFDLVVVKLASRTGIELWRREINGTANNDDVARSVAVDSANDVVVAGKTTDAVTSGNFAVIKLSGTDGTTKWIWTTTETGEAHAVAVNSKDEVIAAGATNLGFAVVKLARNNGKVIWRQELPRQACCLDTAFSVAVDSHDNVLAAGQRQQDFATVKMAGDTGAVIWSRQINGTGTSGEQANRVAVDPNDDVVVAGFINNGGTDFDWDFTVIKFAGLTGVTQWAQLIDGGTFGAFDEARDLVIDGFGDVYVTGDIATDAFGSQDLAVVKFAGRDGSVRWRHTAPLRSRGNAIAIDSEGNVSVAGEFLEFIGDPDSGVVKLDGRRGFHFPVTSVSIDIRPKSDANRINPNSSGNINVAILSGNGFDARTIDPDTVRFGATGTEAAPVNVGRRDVDGDGDRDVVLRFQIPDAGIKCGDTSASLTGQTFTGFSILGSNPIRTVGCK